MTQPIALISARFDKGPVEETLRAAHKILQASQCDVRMVEADPKDNFGDLTVKYLNDIRKTSGIMLAACTRTYGEKGATAFGSFQELQYAVEKQITILPLKFDPNCYPPEPPCGSGHNFDPDSLAEAYVQFAFRNATVWLDCIGKTAQQVATGIEQAIDKHAAQRREPLRPVQQPQVVTPLVPAYRLLRTNAPRALRSSATNVQNSQNDFALQLNQLCSQAVGTVGQCKRAGMPEQHLRFLHASVFRAQRLQEREQICLQRYFLCANDPSVVAWQQGWYNKEIACCNSELYHCIQYARALLQSQVSQPRIITGTVPHQQAAQPPVADPVQQRQRMSVPAQHGYRVTATYGGYMKGMRRMGGEESDQQEVETGSTTVGTYLASFAATRHHGQFQDEGLRLVACTDDGQLDLDDPLPANFVLDIVPLEEKAEDQETEDKCVDLRRKMFRECDKDEDEVLRRPDWPAMAAMLQYDATDEKYNEICDVLGVDHKQGISVAKFEELLTGASPEELESLLQFGFEEKSGARCPDCSQKYTRTVQNAKSTMFCDDCNMGGARSPHFFECVECDRATCSWCALKWA